MMYDIDNLTANADYDNENSLYCDIQEWVIVVVTEANGFFVFIILQLSAWAAKRCLPLSIYQLYFLLRISKKKNK